MTKVIKGFPTPDGVAKYDYNELENKPDLDRYVNKEEGKQLSTNDFTDDDKMNLDASATKEEIRKLIPKPEDAPTVGKILKVKSVNEDGTFVCEWGDAPSGQSTDVQINGTSITADGVANIPISNFDSFGVIKIKSAGGLKLDTRNNMIVAAAGPSNMRLRHSGFFIDASNADDMVKLSVSSPVGVKGLIDGVYHYPAWTEEEQSNAIARLGAVKKDNWEVIAEGTTEEVLDLLSIEFPYPYKKIRMYIGKGSNVYIPVGVSGANVNFYINGTNICAPYFASNYQAYIEYDVEMSNIMNRREGIMYAGGQYSLYGFNSNYCRFGTYGNYVPEDAINSIAYGFSGGKQISSGTIYKVYGVRA